MDGPQHPPGTIIIQQQQQQGGGQPGSAWPWLFGLLAPFLGFMFFAGGHGAIDQPDPDTATAGTMYSLAALVGFASIVGPMLRRQHRFTFAGALPLAVLFGWFIADAFDGAYGDDGFGMALFHMMIVLPLVGLGYLVAALTTTLMRRGLGPSWGMQMVGTGIAAGYGVAAIYHLSTLQRQADEARAAYAETPGLGLAIVVLALLGLAWARRR